MGSSKDVVADILRLLEPLDVRARSMFGEYGVYCDEKFIAVVCDDRFFLKPTDAVATLDVELEAGPPYPGAKDYLIVDDRLMQNRTKFQRLVQATADVLPVPRPKKASKKKRAARRKR